MSTSSQRERERGSDAEAPVDLHEAETQAPGVAHGEFEFDFQEATAGRYEYVRDIGVGGMGRVMLARDTLLQREVAVKVLEVSPDSEVQDGTARFVREATITASLVHPGIVPIYDLGQTPGDQHFFIMQVVEGVTFRDLLVRARMATASRAARVPHFLSILVRVCQAVGYAHHKGIVHLDLKPTNIMEGAFGEVMVMDWGVAKRAEELGRASPKHSGPEPQALSEDEKTPTHEVIGTPGFMAPEQYYGEPNRLGPATDVFALGVILYEILSSGKPFPGKNASEIRMAVCTGCWMPLQTAAKTSGAKRIPRELVAICEKALAAEPASRYPSAREMGDDVQAYMEHRAVSAFRENPYRLLRRWQRRHRAAGAALLGAAMAAMVGMALWLVDYTSWQQHLRVFEQLVAQGREDYTRVIHKAEWTKLVLARAQLASTEQREELAAELRSMQTKSYLAAQHLRSAIRALLTAQREDVDPALCREFRQLWLDEMELARREGLTSYVRISFMRMQGERGRLPWWNWEPYELGRVERLRSWLIRERTGAVDEATEGQEPPTAEDNILSEEAL